MFFQMQPSNARSLNICVVGKVWKLIQDLERFPNTITKNNIDFALGMIIKTTEYYAVR